MGAGRFRAARRWLCACALALPGLASAGELHESVDDPSAFSTVIDASQFDDRFATVQELLDQVPGARVTRSGSIGARSTISIRAAKAEQVLVLLDGVRLNSPSRGSADLSTIPLRQVARIEVIRGGGAARYGSDAVGGVVVITTRQAANDGLHADAALTGGGLELRGGDVSLSAAGDRGSALLTYSRLSSENDYHFDLTTTRSPQQTYTFQRLNADFAEDAGLLRGSLRLSPDAQLDATVDLYQKDGGQPGSVFGKPISHSTSDDLSCTTSDESYRRGIARLGLVNQQFLSGAFELAGSVRAEDSLLDDPGGACGFVRPIVTGGRDHASWRERESALESSWQSQRWSFDGIELETRAVAALRYTTVDSSDADLHRRTLLSGSLLPQLAFFGRTLRILPALGVEGASSSAGLAREAGFGSLVETTPHDPTAWLPSVGAILEVAPGLRLKANWKKVLRRPTFTELYHPDWSFIRGNPELEPERGWNADVGFELASHGVGVLDDWGLEMTLFQRELDQGIEWLLSRGNAYMPLNTGRARALGGEASLHSTWFHRLQLAASYTYTDARYLDRPPEDAAFQSGQRVVFPHVPMNSLSANAGLELDVLRPWAELRYDSEFAYRAGQIQPLAPASFQVDAGVILRPSRIPRLSFLPDALALSLEADNLTHEQRSDSLGQPLSKQTLWIFRIRGATP
ncbi:MAG TPA: TonB-dependent receptor [Myxococcota bacterium]|nr:TonB-dependent receptor [Myxococcota bacterium]